MGHLPIEWVKKRGLITRDIPRVQKVRGKILEPIIFGRENMEVWTAGCKRNCVTSIIIPNNSVQDKLIALLLSYPRLSCFQYHVESARLWGNLDNQRQQEIKKALSPEMEANLKYALED